MNSKLLLTDLIQTLVDKGFARKDAEAFVRCFFQQVEKSVFAGDSVKIGGMGTFKLQKVEPRRSVNVNTGEQIEIEGHYKFSYLPDADLKSAVNKPYAHLTNVEIDESSDKPLFSVYDPDGEDRICMAEPVPDRDIPQTPSVEPASNKDAVENTDVVTGNPGVAGTLLKVLGACLLLAGIIFMFIHSESRRTVYTDSPQITVVAEDAVDSAYSEPVQQSDSVPVVDENPENWDILRTVTVERGDRLTIYSLQYYGNKIFWVYLFLANRDVIDNPNSLSAGTVIKIPKAPESVVNAEDTATIIKARAIEEQLKGRYD